MTKPKKKDFTFTYTMRDCAKQACVDLREYLQNELENRLEELYDDPIPRIECTPVKELK